MKELKTVSAVLIAAGAGALLLTQAFAQTRQSGPWWPSPHGPEDQAGASNWITPEVVLRAVELVEHGKIYELGQVYEPGMPKFGKRTYSLTIPGGPTYSGFGKNELIGNDEFLCTEIGQVGTQFDGLAHIGKRIMGEDGHFEDIYYNGFKGRDIITPYGVTKLGIEPPPVEYSTESTKRGPDPYMEKVSLSSVS